MKAIYVAREDGDYDFVAAFDLEKVGTLTDSDENEYFSDLVLSLKQDGEDVEVREADSISDFSDVLSSNAKADSSPPVQSLLDTGGDKRPKRGGWAPGNYECTCLKCFEEFVGDKRACMCADCAYGTNGRGA